MKEKIKKAYALLSSMPLLILTILVAAALSVIAYWDPEGVYAGYEKESGYEPGFVRIMKDISGMPVSGTQTAVADVNASDFSVADEAGDGVVEKSGNGETLSGESEDTGNMSEAGSSDTAGDEAAGKTGNEKTTPGDAKENESIQETENAKDNGDEGGTVRKEDTEDSDEKDAPVKPAELDLTIPKESRCEVCPAKDYGLAQQIYMAPEGWEPPVDTTGYFATNGYYRTLHEVDAEYFSDALFIGDSRVDGLCDYGGLEDYATFACKDSLTVYKLFTESLRYKDPYGGKGYRGLYEILEGRHFHKIYLQIGINELGTGNTAEFYEAYRNAVATIKAKQPTAIIYIEGIMHVTGARSSSDSVFTNSLVVDKNKAIETLANGRDIFYLDMNPAVCDENGNLRSDLSMDHAHLKAKAHVLWTEFLMQNAASPEEPAAPVYLTE